MSPVKESYGGFYLGLRFQSGSPWQQAARAGSREITFPTANTNQRGNWKWREDVLSKPGTTVVLPPARLPLVKVPPQYHQMSTNSTTRLGASIQIYKPKWDIFHSYYNWKPNTHQHSFSVFPKNGSVNENYLHRLMNWNAEHLGERIRSCGLEGGISLGGRLWGLKNPHQGLERWLSG